VSTVEDDTPDGLRLLDRGDIGALAAQRLDQLVGHRILDDEDALVGAQDRVVEGLARHNPACGHRDVGRGIDENGDVARTDAEGRVSTAIGRPDHR
jgi:hypothetical protein